MSGVQVASFVWDGDWRIEGHPGRGQKNRNLHNKREFLIEIHYHTSWCFNKALPGAARCRNPSLLLLPVAITCYSRSHEAKIASVNVSCSDFASVNHSMLTCVFYIQAGLKMLLGATHSSTTCILEELGSSVVLSYLIMLILCVKTWLSHLISAGEAEEWFSYSCISEALILPNKNNFSIYK